MILEADGRERNARIGGVSKNFPMESQWTDPMSGLKTKKLGICWSPMVGDSFGRLAEIIIRHGWPPARPSIPTDEAEQKAGWLARADTRVPALGSTQKPHACPPQGQPTALVAFCLLFYCGAPQMDWP